MGWKDLLSKPETLICPWVGGRSFQFLDRTFEIQGKVPTEHGWYEFEIGGSKRVKLLGPAEAKTDILTKKERGFLVGDRFVSDDVRVEGDVAKVAHLYEAVNLIEDGLDRFARVSVGRAYSGGPLIYSGQDMPLGCEGDVSIAFMDGLKSVSAIKDVPPALDAAFRFEVWQKEETEKRRIELERLRREEEENRIREEKRQDLIKNLGDGNTRRQLATIDFESAARAALTVSGATLLDYKKSLRKGEYTVRFGFIGRRFECVCNERLAIIDSGICLNAHEDDDLFEEGTKGDTWFTLESLPAVIAEANREGKLVVFRHVR